MKVIYNRWIPFEGFIAINILGIIFIRKEYKNVYLCNILKHEKIHTQQMKEMLFIFFYLWYFIEFIIRFFKYFNAHTAYKNISFEVEAVEYSRSSTFRKRYGWIKYLFKSYKY